MPPNIISTVITTAISTIVAPLRRADGPATRREPGFREKNRMSRS
ncbi:MAG: hypothetical protein V4813_00230 [Gemmatimonadota bacterium]